ncbi:MAG: hypothetical protein ACE5LU_00460 [Anaerolineae bacterium]
MANETQGTSFADFLSDLSVAVVVALQSRGAATTEELRDHLAELVQAANASNEPQLAAYFDVLHGLLQGDDVTAAAEGLVEPYRAGYERILQELAEEPSEMTLSEWLTQMTTIVVTTARLGSHEDRSRLEQELAGLARKVPSEDTGLQNFLAALRGVLRGEDTREFALRQRPPYREAFHSLLQLLAADDASEFTVHALLDRIQHNTIVALTQRNRELRLVVAEGLADIVEKLPEDGTATDHFRPLIVGALALLLDREPPAAVNTLPEPFAETWRNILAASQK